MLQEMENSKAESCQNHTAKQCPDQDQNFGDKPERKNADGEGYATVPATEFENQSTIHSQGGETTDRLSSGSSKSVHWSPESVNGSAPSGSDANVARALSPESSSFSFIETMVAVKNALGRWRRKVGEATKKAEDLAGNTWQHLKTSPSFAEAAMGRIAQGTKILAEGGYERVFQQSFETDPEEQLRTYYACYLNTSAGPVMGILYLSTEKIAYCSDSPLSHKNGSQTEWSYLKVIIPLHQLKAVHPSSSRTNPAEKYIQVNTVDDLEFWFMGFLDYEGAVQVLQEACSLNLPSV